MPLHRYDDVGRRKHRHRVQARRQALTSIKNEIQPTGNQVFKEVSVRLKNLKRHLRQFGLKVVQHARNPDRASVVVSRNPYRRADRLRRNDGFGGLQDFQGFQNRPDAGYAAPRGFRRHHLKTASHKKRLVPIPAQLGKHPVGGRQTHAQLIRRPRQRLSFHNRQKEDERFRIHPFRVVGEPFFPRFDR